MSTLLNFITYTLRNNNETLITSILTQSNFFQRHKFHPLRLEAMGQKSQEELLLLLQCQHRQPIAKFFSTLSSQLKLDMLLPAPNAPFICRTKPSTVQLVASRQNEQKTRNTIKHHTAKYMLTFHLVIQGTHLKIISIQKQTAEFSEHMYTCTQFSHPAESCSHLLRFKHLKPQMTGTVQTHGCQLCFGKNGIFPRIQYGFRFLLSSFSVSSTTETKSLEFHIRVQFN